MKDQPPQFAPDDLPIHLDFRRTQDGHFVVVIGEPTSPQHRAIELDDEHVARVIAAAPKLHSALKLSKRYVDEHCEDLEAHAEELSEQALQKFHSLPIWQRAMATRQAVNGALFASEPQP